MSVKGPHDAVSAENLHRNLFRLASDPLPFRTMNYTIPGHDKCSLYEADDLIVAELAGFGLDVVRTPHRVQAYRCDRSKPLHHWYSQPPPEDTWYTAHNLEVTIPGRLCQDEIIQLVSHKDSMSWIDSPGAHDNAAGTAANVEIARILSTHALSRTVRILFCNEEHTPWTSRPAAEAARARGDKIIAVLNQDSLAGKSDAERAAGRLTHAACFSTREGEALADLMLRVNETHEIGLDATKAHKGRVNDDDGMFIEAGYRTTVANIGSFPYADKEYHLPGDHPDRVDVDNLCRSTRLVLATVLELDAKGGPALGSAPSWA
jgi:hypothetical protein